MSKFLPVLLKDGARDVEVKDASTRRSIGSRLGFLGRLSKWSYTTGWDVDRAVRDGYERVLWAYRCIDAIASNEARLPIRKVKGEERDGAPLKDPVLRLLNRRANDWESAFIFRYRLVSQLLLSKKGVFVEVVYSNAGEPVRLHLLPPGDTNIVPDANEFIKGFNVNLGEGEPQFLPAKDPATGKPKVIWIRKPHPIDPYMGVTPLEAAGLSIDMDYFARLYNRTFLLNDGRPGGILGIKGDLEEADAQELQSRWSGGPNQAGRVSVIEAESLDWVDTAISPRDAQYAQILKMTKDDLLTGFGTPESVLGNASNRTYENADAEREVFWQETMPSYLDLIDGAFDAITEGGLEDDTFLIHDVSTVEALQRASWKRREQLLKELTQGAITIDEYREAIEKDAFDVPETRSLWIPSSQTQIKAEEDREDDEETEPPVPALPPAPVQPALPPAPEAEEDDDEANAAVSEVTAALGLLSGLSVDARRKVAQVFGVVPEEDSGGGGPFWKAATPRPKT